MLILWLTKPLKRYGSLGLYTPQGAVYSPGSCVLPRELCTPQGAVYFPGSWERLQDWYWPNDQGQYLKCLGIGKLDRWHNVNTLLLLLKYLVSSKNWYYVSEPWGCTDGSSSTSWGMALQTNGSCCRLEFQVQLQLCISGTSSERYGRSFEFLLSEFFILRIIFLFYLQSPRITLHKYMSELIIY